MSTQNNHTGHYLAVFTSNKGSAKWRAWYAMGEDERRVKDEAGLAALKAWDEAHRDVIVYQGGPLGATKRASETDVGRAHRRWPRARGSILRQAQDKLTLPLVAAHHERASAGRFEGHPHMTLFPRDAVDVMPLLVG